MADGPTPPFVPAGPANASPSPLQQQAEAAPRDSPLFAELQLTGQPQLAVSKPEPISDTTMQLCAATLPVTSEDAQSPTYTALSPRSALRSKCPGRLAEKGNIASSRPKSQSPDNHTSVSSGRRTSTRPKMTLRQVKRLKQQHKWSTAIRMCASDLGVLADAFHSTITLDEQQEQHGWYADPQSATSQAGMLFTVKDPNWLEAHQSANKQSLKRFSSWQCGDNVEFHERSEHGCKGLGAMSQA